MASNSANRQSPSPAHARRVVFVLYPGVTLIDVTGPLQVFSSTNEAPSIKQVGAAGYEILLASRTGGPVPTDTGVALDTVSLQQATRKGIDTLIVAGGNGVFDAAEDRALVRWLKARRDNCRRLASTCMGTFLTAAAGIHDGHEATTHWRHVETLERLYPNVLVQSSPIFVKSGNVWSAAGGTSGIDLALAMVEEDFGHDIAMEVSQALVVFLKRPGDQAQFSNVLAAQRRDGGGRFSSLHAWIADNLTDALHIETLADRAGMSPRSFARLYKQATGKTPARSVEAIRVETAKRLLQEGDRPLAEIAAAVGLKDVQGLRRSFQRQVGILPAEFRERFGQLKPLHPQ